MTRWLWLVVASACSTTGSAPASPQAALNGAVAVAGNVGIDAEIVARVAAARGETAREALDDLLFDAVLAQGAVARGLDAQASVREAQRTTRARLVTDHIEADALAKGPPTDAEVAVATERHWREVDLPEQWRAVHVIVMSKDPAKQVLAHAVAEDLRRAVLGATDAADFLGRARQVDARGLTVRPEMLPLFVADGRIVEGDGELDATFVHAATALAPGDTSPVVETPFGLHVIRVLERLPPKQVPLEERRLRYKPEVLAQRGHEVYARLMADLKRAHTVVIEPSADALMATAR